MQNFEPEAALIGQGAAQYTPQKADPSRGFGVWEVHPNRVPTENNGSIKVLWNGEYLAVGEIDGQPYHFVSCGINENFTARECAERLCALNNNNRPTRVIDHLGRESVSRHTRDSVVKELSAR